jgi:phosphate acetyltransferase
MLSKAPHVCPPRLLAMASSHAPLRTAVANAGSQIAMESAKLAVDEGVIEPVLIGDLGEIKSIATSLQWDLSGVQLVAAANDVDAAKLAASLAGSGEVAAIMKGHVHTDDLMRAVLSTEAKLRTDRRLSHVFHMTVPGEDRPLCITDAVINVLPSVADKIDIMKNAIALMHALGNKDPAVALLSGTETANESMPSSMDAAEIAALAESGDIAGARIAGPLAFDIAVSAEAASIKGISNAVAGDADVLVVPNIESGNFLFKQMVYFMSATAAGVVLGAKVPVMLTSRADPPVARLASAALASIYQSFNNRT